MRVFSMWRCAAAAMLLACSCGSDDSGSGGGGSDAASLPADAGDDADQGGGGCQGDTECDDGDPCTDDACSGGKCVSTPRTGSCDDGDACTTGDVCKDGACAGVPRTCEDDDPCTTGSCSGGECTFAHVDGCCKSDAECAEGRTCISHACATELSWDDGKGLTSIDKQTWTVTDQKLPLGSALLYQATRFELAHPGRVLAVSVQFASLPAGADTPVTIGIHPDFGHNGFDFWQKDPYWVGSKPAGEVQAGQWTMFVPDEPVVLDHPGLVYVAHRREGLDDASVLMDNSTSKPDGSCGDFADCHSSITLPDLHYFMSGGQSSYAWNGLSFPFQYDFMFRLHVEYTAAVTPEQWIFQPAAGGPPMGNRAAWGDVDNDGDDDLFTPPARLFTNDGGVFVEVTEESGIAAMGIAGSGGVLGDIDNDGCLDIFVFVESTSAPDSLLRNNCDGTFSDITEASGISDVQTYNDCGKGDKHTPTPAAAFFDIDADGLLDLYLANMICWDNWTFYRDTVWHNEGGGVFTDWTGKNGFAGYSAPALSSRGASPIDYDRDGDVDILINRYTLHPNALYRNLGGGTVENVAEAVGAAGDPSFHNGYKYYGHTIGAVWGDLNGDGHFDIVESNLAHPRFWDFSDKTRILLSDGAGAFADNQGDWSYPAGGAGLRYQETHSVPALGDFDHDGHLDLTISAVYPGRPWDFYWGNGDGTFLLDSYHAGIPVTNGWGVALADYDRDGDLDMATSGGLFENTLPAAEGARWLQVRPVTAGCKRPALGATVRVVAGERSFIRHVSGGNGQGGQDSQAVHFGLGAATSVDWIEVRFPGAEPKVYAGPFETGQMVWVCDNGAAESGFSPPAFGAR